MRISAGAGFIVVLTGKVMTMPGLPKLPAAERIDVDEEGNITGLFSHEDFRRKSSCASLEKKVAATIITMER